MNKLETLPKHLEYKNGFYALAVWVTAWNNLCIGYKLVDGPSDQTHILSTVVEPNNEPFIPNTIEPQGLNDNIGNARTLDDAIDVVQSQISRFNINVATV